MGLRALLVLVLLVGGLAAGLWLTSGAETSHGTLTEPLLGGRRLLEARRVLLRNEPDAEPLRLERHGAVFDLVEPLRDLASASRLRAIADAYDQATRLRVYGKDEASDEILRQTGLDRPRAEIVLTWEDAEQRLEIGARGPLGRDLFVREGDSIYRSGLALWTVIQGTANDFRERIVFRNDADSVRTLRIRRRHADGKLDGLVLQRGGGGYALVAPIAARADPAAARRLLAAICGMRADRFLSGNLNLTPRPAADFEIELAGGAGTETCRLWIQPDASLIGFQEQRKLEFGLAISTYASLLRAPVTELRSRLLVPFVPDSLRRIVLDPGDGGKVLTLERGMSNLLRLTTPVQSVADPTAVAKLLQALRRLHAVEFVPPGATDRQRSGLGKGHFTVTIMGPFSVRPTVLYLGQDRGELTYARRADEQHVVMVPGAVAASLRRPWVAFVGRRAVQMRSVEMVRRLLLARGAHGTEFRLGRDRQWHRGADREVADGIDDLVAELTDVRAKSVVDLDLAAPADDEVRIELQRENGDVLEELRLQMRGGKGYLRTRRVHVLYEVKTGLRDAVLSAASRLR